jgi:hypothetical protein
MGGPSLGGYGFWNGARTADVCVALSKAPSSLWLSNPAECEELIERHFVAFFISTQTAVYVFATYKFVSHVWTYVFFTRPVMARVELVMRQISEQKQYSIEKQD